jgi:hypothetical protein
MQPLGPDDAEEDVEEETPETAGFRFQFGISTLLYLMSGLAVLCGTVAFLGLLPVLMIVSIAGGRPQPFRSPFESLIVDSCLTGHYL